MERYELKWNWDILSRNEALPWSDTLIERYADRWDWEGRLTRPYDFLLRWKGAFDRFPSNAGLTANRALPWTALLIERYAGRWKWAYIPHSALSAILPYWDELSIRAVMARRKSRIALNPRLGYADGWDAYQRKDYELAFLAWEPLAKNGNAHAQYNLGLLYETGCAVAQDNLQAMHWYRKAAEQGNAAAQRNLGKIYEISFGIAQDAAQAVEWYRQAAQQHDAVAQYNLGRMYEGGRGVAQDDGQAMYWYASAAFQGNSAAQDSLLRMSNSGLKSSSVSQNPTSS